MSNKKPYKSFDLFLKSLKNSKQLRVTIYPSPKSKCNTVSHYSRKLVIPESTIKLLDVDQIGRKAFIPEKVKNFAFNFVRNRIKLGAQQSHFAEVDGDCLLCKKFASISIPETCHHVFFTCKFYKNMFSETPIFFF